MDYMLLETRLVELLVPTFALFGTLDDGLLVIGDDPAVKVPGVRLLVVLGQLNATLGRVLLVIALIAVFGFGLPVILLGLPLGLLPVLLALDLLACVACVKTVLPLKITTIKNFTLKTLSVIVIGAN